MPSLALMQDCKRSQSPCRRSVSKSHWVDGCPGCCLYPTFAEKEKDGLRLQNSGSIDLRSHHVGCATVTRCGPTTHDQLFTPANCVAIETRPNPMDFAGVQRNIPNIGVGVSGLMAVVVCCATMRLGIVPANFFWVLFFVSWGGTVLTCAAARDLTTPAVSPPVESALSRVLCFQYRARQPLRTAPWRNRTARKP